MIPLHKTLITNFLLTCNVLAHSLCRPSFLKYLTCHFFFFFFWLCWVLTPVRGLSPAAASGGHPPPRCAGLSPSRPLPLRSTGSRRAGPAIMAHGPSCSAACGIPPDQGPNPRPPHRQADSQPLCHQGSPNLSLLNSEIYETLL